MRANCKRFCKEVAKEELYACFPTLNEYATLLENAQDYRGQGNWRVNGDSEHIFLNTSDTCSSRHGHTGLFLFTETQ